MESTDTEASWGRALAGKFSVLSDLGTGMKNPIALLGERLKFTVLLSLSAILAQDILIAEGTF